MKFEVNSSWHNCKNSNYNLIFSYFSKPKNEKKFDIRGKYKRFFYECLKCKHIFASHHFKLSNIYNQDYLDLTYKNIKGVSYRFNEIINLPFSHSDNKKRAKRIHNFLKKRSNLLDIGSGIGVFLYEMKKKGHNVLGQEMDKRYSVFLKKKNLTIMNKRLTKLNLKKNFDIITLNKVLEHLKNPISLLLKIKNFLSVNGIVYIEVPDANSKVKGKFCGEFCLDHLQLFTKKSLNDLMNVAGYKTLNVQNIIEPSGKYTIFGFFRKNKL